MEREDIYIKATKRVKAKKSFVYHLIAYVFVIGMFYSVFRFSNANTMFPVVFVALGWGIGIAAHYFNAFGTEQLGFLGINPNWEEEELEFEIEKLARKRELKERLIHEEQLLADMDRLELRDTETIPISLDIKES